tara:strand:+ start:737 stop:1198 length:462 start_codon:yes stop_codon:yes gene_type:complete
MRNQAKIYSASKVWLAPFFQELRDSEGYNIVSRWIDLDNDSKFVTERKDLLWEMCLEDCIDCDLLICYCREFEENQRGALVEIGHVLALGKPVFCVNDCVTLSPCPESDVAFTHHENFHWVNDPAKGRISAKMGFYRAMRQFQAMQREQRIAA